MKYDIVIAGGGIVGLATALNLKTEKPELNILVLEKEDKLSSHQTGNNSGVIHSGIYYKPGSLKAINCIEGYKRLITFCDENQIPYELSGKIIVALNEDEVEKLDVLYQRGLENKLEGLKILTKEQIKEYEPHCNGIKGVFVPQTGIVNYKLVALKYAENFQKLGGEIKTGERVTAIVAEEGNVEIKTLNSSYHSTLFINCAGLFSDKLAAMAGQNLDVRIIPFRGEYYSIKPEKASLVKNLIYPVPDPNFPFLGVHFTRRITGEIEAGPNAVFAFKREGYKKSDINFKDIWESISWPGFRKVVAKYWKTGLGEFKRSYSKNAFTTALQELVPEITKDDLIPAGSGVRAQACDKTGGLIDDFCIREGKGCIHVLNAPSPAATSSLSIGHSIALMAIKRSFS